MISDVEAENYGIYVPCLVAQFTLENRKCSPTEPAQPVGTAMTEHSHKVAASAHKPAPGGLSIHPAPMSHCFIAYRSADFR